MIPLTPTYSGPGAYTIACALDWSIWSACRECFNEKRPVSWLYTNTFGHATPRHGHAIFPVPPHA